MLQGMEHIWKNWEVSETGVKIPKESIKSYVKKKKIIDFRIKNLFYLIYCTISYIFSTKRHSRPKQ